MTDRPPRPSLWRSSLLLRIGWTEHLDRHVAKFDPAGVALQADEAARPSQSGVFGLLVGVLVEVGIDDGVAVDLDLQMTASAGDLHPVPLSRRMIDLGRCRLHPVERAAALVR